MASSSRWLLAAMALPALSLSSGCGGPPRGEPPRPALSSSAPEIEPEPDMEGDAPDVASADLPSLGVERLRLAWRAPKRLLAILSDGKLVLESGPTPARLELVDGATGALIAPLTVPDPASVVELWAAGTRLSAWQRGALYGIDPGSGATSWKTSIGGLVPVPFADRASSRIVLATRADEWVALEPATGAVRWHVPRGELARTWLSSSRIYAARVGHLDAYRTIDGARAWTFDADRRERWVFGSDATRVVAQSSRGVVSVIDARTGKVTELSGRFSWGDASDHQRALVLGDTVVFSDLERGLTALGLDTGAIRWRRDAPIVDVAAADDALFARTRSGVVRALDPNGSEKWRLGVGEGVPRGLWSIPGLPGGSGLAYVDEDGGRARINVLVRKPETQEASTSPKGGKARIVGTVRVNGALARHLTILVNDDKTRTDALGRFSIEVAVPGKYTVHPAWAELPPPRQDKFDFPGMCCGRGVEGTGSVDVEPREGERAPADLDLRTTCHACRP